MDLYTILEALMLQTKLWEEQYPNCQRINITCAVFYPDIGRVRAVVLVLVNVNS